MTAILGISAFYHDSAAALLVDGELVAAAQEERFTRRKHDERFPRAALAECLRIAGLSLADVDHVAFYDKPLLKFDRLIETQLAFAPRGFPNFLQSIPPWVSRKLWLPRIIKRELGKDYRGRVVYPQHHESHAASAFFPSPFEEAAVITLDGVGEWATASWGAGRGNRLELTHELRFPHSLGLLYSAFTTFCGFRVNSGEYKLMGLAPYGEPRFTDRIIEGLLDLRPDGSFRLRLEHFGYCHKRGTMFADSFGALFGMAPRAAETPLTQAHADLAASIQAVTEEVVLRIGRHVHAQTGSKNLCMAGGVALNCVANGRLLREGPFDRIWVQPAAGDAGGALGAAWLVWHQLLKRPRVPVLPDGQRGSRLGPTYTDAEAAAALDAVGARYQTFDDDTTLCAHVAQRMADGAIVGWMQGPMEFGPRALGGRSILADPRAPEVHERVNALVKFRERFRPFAPSVLASKADDYFELNGHESPYMLLVANVQKAHWREPTAPPAGGGFHLGQRSTIPAITHVDYSARIQTVDERHGRYLPLLEAFEAATGCAVVLNTSFNVRGEPLVCTPDDAWRCFAGAGIDVLVVERCVVERDEQPAEILAAHAAHHERFALD